MDLEVEWTVFTRWSGEDESAADEVRAALESAIENLDFVTFGSVILETWRSH